MIGVPSPFILATTLEEARCVMYTPVEWSVVRRYSPSGVSAVGPPVYVGRREVGEARYDDLSDMVRR